MIFVAVGIVPEADRHRREGLGAGQLAGLAAHRLAVVIEDLHLHAEAAALQLAGYRVDFVPELDNSARGLVKEWPTSDITGRVLIPQSDVAEPNLVAAIEERGLDAQFVVAYRTVGVPVSDDVRADVASGRMTAILVSSGSVARQIAAQLAPLPEATVVACIGPRTAFDARAAGLRVDLIAEDRSADSLVASLVEHATR